MNFVEMDSDLLLTTKVLALDERWSGGNAEGRRSGRHIYITMLYHVVRDLVLDS